MIATNQEKEMLIEQLIKIYPYPKKWFETLSLPQLVAMYNKPRRPKKSNKIHIPESLINYETRNRKVVNGVRFVRTDSGCWEEELD